MTLLAPEDDVIAPSGEAFAEREGPRRELKNAGQIAGWLIAPAIGLAQAASVAIRDTVAALLSGSTILVGLCGLWDFCVLGVCILFFGRNRWTPIAFITLLAVGIVRACLIGLLLVGAQGAWAFAPLAASILGAGVWTPYFLTSRRVRLTFVR